MLSPTGRPRRILWWVNHRTLLPAEVPILRDLGYEVFIPKVVPIDDPDYRSAMVTHEYDATLTIAPAALRVLNEENFYSHSWAPTIRHILGREFDVLICHFSYYTTPLSEAARHFPGLVIARTFGRESPKRYAEFADVGPRRDILSELERLGSRFIHAQGYSNISVIEPPVLQRSAHTVTVPLPASIYASANTWMGTGQHAIFICPDIMAGPLGGDWYYWEVHKDIKRDFGNMPHKIFGRQTAPVDDPSVLPFLSDEELLALYAATPVFVYPSMEPRHIHYSPVEAMVVGAPVLYRRGSLSDVLAGGADLPGACASTEEMRDKAQRLLGGDRALADAIRAGQGRIVETFSLDRARQQWDAILGRAT